MGQSLSMIKEIARRQDIEFEKIANDSLNSLIEFAGAKAELFSTKILASGTADKLVPIKSIISQANFCQASVCEDAPDFAYSLKSTIKQFTSGTFVDGIFHLVTMAIKILLGNYVGNTSQQDSYVIAIGSMGEVVRIDYSLYCYKFTSETLFQISKNVLLVNVMVSSADTTYLDANGVKTFLEKTYIYSPPDQLKAMYEEIMQGIKKVNSVTPLKNSNLGNVKPKGDVEDGEERKSDEVRAQARQETSDLMKCLQNYYENYHNYIYAPDAIIYQDIFEARDKQVIQKVGNPQYDDNKHSQNRWEGQRLIMYGHHNEKDGNGAKIKIPQGYDTLWVRLNNDVFNSFKCSFIDGKNEEIGIFSTGFRSLSQLAPDGAARDAYWNRHVWVPVPVGRAGSVALVSRGEADFWLSGVAFSKNIWKIATNSAHAYQKAYNGGDAFVIDIWHNDQIGVLELGRSWKLKVPVLPSSNDKLLYFVEHDSDWDGLSHTSIKVNGQEIERLKTSYDNPLARHFNSKLHQLYAAAKIPKRLIPKDARFIEVTVDMVNHTRAFHFREAGTHDYILPTTLMSIPE